MTVGHSIVGMSVIGGAEWSFLGVASFLGNGGAFHHVFGTRLYLAVSSLPAVR